MSKGIVESGRPTFGRNWIYVPFIPRMSTNPARSANKGQMSCKKVRRLLFFVLATSGEASLNFMDEQR